MTITNSTHSNKKQMTTKVRKPVGLVARAASSKQINITWEPAPPSAGVVTYLIERREPQSYAKSGFAQIAAVAVTNYTDSKGLFSETRYEYRVRGADIVGNVSAYSNIAVAETRPRQPALKEYYDKVQAKIDLDPEDHDSLCQLKAIEATLNASKKTGWPDKFCGKGWATDVHYAIAGYEAAKTATYKPGLGSRSKFFFYTARARIWEVAQEEADSSGAKRSHKKNDPEDANRYGLPNAKKPQVHRFSSSKENQETIAGEIPVTLDEVVMLSLTDTANANVARADAEMTVDRQLERLKPEQTKLLRLRIGEEVTLAALAADSGRSKSTIDRDVKNLLAKIQQAAHNEELV
jgi:RNA polymerase sigma factor (sigma-70 family)